MKYWKITYENPRSPSGASVCYKYGRSQEEAIAYFKKVHGISKKIVSIKDEALPFG